VYVTNTGSASVSQYTVGPDGALAPKTPAAISTGLGPQGVAVSADGASVYVTNTDDASLSQFDVGAGGVLSRKAPDQPNPGGTPRDVTVSPDGANLYVANSSSHTVSQFSLGAGGVLQPHTPFVANGYAAAIAVSPNGGSLYATVGRSPNDVMQFSIGADGVLLPKEPATIPTGVAPVDMALSPDGANLYVTGSYRSNVVWQYDAAADGGLAHKTPATVAAGDHPTGVAVSPDQGPAAAFAAVIAPAGSATRLDGSGSSDRDGDVARYDWDFGDGTTAPDGGRVVTHAYAAGTYEVRLTVTDNAGCSTAFVFTGQTASCAGGPAATTTRTITIAPPPAAPAAGCGRSTSKLALARATFDRAARTISIFAPITRKASGRVEVTLRGAGRTTRFTVPVDRRHGRVRATRRISAAQARLRTAILTIAYGGDADTRPQSLRLRAANRAAGLRVRRPEITSGGYLRAGGTVSPAARGVVRVQLQYVAASDGRTLTVQRTGRIVDGRWSISRRLPSAVLRQIAQRCGSMHSYTSFTGQLRGRLRGELRALQVRRLP
jgi:DNA-binding beta-propeller fold protein YncE